MNKKLAILIALVAFGILVFVYVTQTIEVSPIMKEQRLGDVVTAILVMGTEKFDSHKPKDWKKRIGASPKSADSWSDIFKEHSEFFHLRQDKEGNDKVSLIWHRA